MTVGTGNRTAALARLDVLAGEWTMEVQFPGPPPAEVPAGASGGPPVAHAWFEWTLDRQYLLQRTEVPVPAAPDSLAIISADPETGAYTQHYFDARGVVRLYSMTMAAEVWTLTRTSPDFSPLDFEQRFTGTFSADRATITGAWEKRLPGRDWEHDFGLTYRRTG